MNELITITNPDTWESDTQAQLGLPEPGVDRNGLAMPLSAEEARERWAKCLEGLSRIDAEDDDPPLSIEEFKREMNEERKREDARLIYRES
jgi:hypothetical protein